MVAAFETPPEPQTVPTYDSDGIAIRIPVPSIPDQGTAWLGIKDSNLDKQSQSLWCYRYTNPQCGGGEGDRTPDPRLAKPVLSQLSYAPKVAEGVGFEPTVAINYGGFQDRCLKPLGHPSICGAAGRI